MALAPSYSSIGGGILLWKHAFANGPNLMYVGGIVAVSC